MQTFDIVLQMETYIAHPYWPELNDVIDIQKKSGMNYQRSEEKRLATLIAYLEQNDMTLEDYQALKAKAERPWYRIDDDDNSSEIVIPRHQFSAALVQTCKVSPSSVIKTAWASDLRNRLRVSDLYTGKTTCDEIFRRYVKGEDSNQRRLTENEVLKDFKATGTLTFDPKELSEKTVKALVSYAVSRVGLGACRKMAYGRGELISLEAC